VRGDGLLERLGCEGLDARLLERALTHRSWTTEHPADQHSERLEFLGDAVLDLAVSVLLHDADPDADEGALSRRRAHLVREESLAEVARAIGIGPALRLGRGEAASGGADKDSLLADALEAVIGAVQLDLGHDAACALVARLFRARLVDADAVGRDPKTALQERVAALGRGVPDYLVDRSGPDHAPEFTARALVGGEELGRGSGGSKKEASQRAAEEALRRLLNG
jgi:ribonuclease III